MERLVFLRVTINLSVCDPGTREQFEPSAPQQGSENQRQENLCGNCDMRNQINKHTFEHLWMNLSRFDICVW